MLSKYVCCVTDLEPEPNVASVFHPIRFMFITLTHVDLGSPVRMRFSHECPVQLKRPRRRAKRRKITRKK